MTCCYSRRSVAHSPSSETLLIVDGNLYRDPQLNNMQRVRDFAALSLLTEAGLKKKTLQQTPEKFRISKYFFRTYTP